MSPPTHLIRICLIFELGSTVRGLTEIKRAVDELAILFKQIRTVEAAAVAKTGAAG
jgi:hypothetical protein